MLGMGKRIAFEKTKNVGLIFPFFQGRVQTMMNLPLHLVIFLSHQSFIAAFISKELLHQSVKKDLDCLEPGEYRSRNPRLL